MIKKIMMVLMISLTFNTIKAQFIRLGVFANPVISWMNSDVSGIHSNGTRTNAEFGLSIDNYFAPQYAFSSGISIINTGGDLLYNNIKTLPTSEGSVALPANTDVYYKLQYIHIPLAIKMRTVQMGNMSFFAQMGFDPMVNVQASADINALNLTNEGVGNEIKPIYLAYHLSAGMEYHIGGTTGVIVGLTYMNGFSDITNDGSANITMDCFELRIGVFF
jgi:hypothetical protein